MTMVADAAGRSSGKTQGQAIERGIVGLSMLFWCLRLAIGGVINGVHDMVKLINFQKVRSPNEAGRSPISIAAQVSRVWDE